MVSKKILAIVIIIILVAAIAGVYLAVFWKPRVHPIEPIPEQDYFVFKGSVTDNATNPIEGANVTLYRMGTGTAKYFLANNVTDSTGNYSISGDYVSPDNYTVTAEATGYEKATSSLVQVTNATDYTVDFILKPLVLVTGVYLEPSEITFSTSEVHVGHRFNVTAMVSDVTDLYAFQVALYYNASVINMTNAFLPADHVLAGQPGFRLGPVSYHFGSWGVGFVGWMSQGTIVTFNGSGKLAVFEFEIIAEPPGGGSLTSDLIISYKVTGGAYECKLKDSVADYISFTATDGHYEYTG